MYPRIHLRRWQASSSTQQPEMQKVHSVGLCAWANRAGLNRFWNVRLREHSGAQPIQCAWRWGKVAAKAPIQ